MSLRIGIVVAVITTVLGCPGGAAGVSARGEPISWRVDKAPFALHLLRDDVRFLSQALGPAPPGRRLGYRLWTGQDHSVTRLLGEETMPDGTRYLLGTDEPGRQAVLEVRPRPEGIAVSWRLEPGEGVMTISDSFRASPREHFTGTGARPTGVDLRRRIVPIKVWNACRSNIAVPFFVSSRGWGLRVIGSTVGRVAFPGAIEADQRCELGTTGCPVASAVSAVQVCIAAARLDYELFTGEPLEITRSFSRATGLPMLPRPAELAAMQWRDEVKSPTELVQDAARLRKLGIPLGWVILDNPWEQCGAGTLSFGSRVGDPRSVVRELKRQGVKLMIWIAPYIRAECVPGPYSPRSLTGAPGSFRAVDLTDPLARATFEAQLQALVQLGVRGFKGDRGDEIDLERVPLHGGSGTELHNEYARLFSESATAVLRRAGGDYAAIFRAATVGSSHVTPGFWAGDQHGSWDGLEEAISLTATASASGFPVFGTDIGGYKSAGLTAEIFARWAGFAAITPVFEVGGQGLNGTPWALGSRAVSALRRSAILHYELFPHLYELLRIASRTGSPALRPLALQYPHDERAWGAQSELLVGPHLLAAPVTRPGTRADVYVPEGDWVDVWHGTTVDGPAEVARPTPLDELPLYLAAGSAIPFDLRTPGIWRAPWRLNDLGRTGRAGWLVAPGRAVTRGAAGSAGQLRVRRRAHRLELQLSGAPRETQVLLLGVREAESVTIAGRPAGRASSAAALRARRTGWLTTARPVPGLMLKLAPRSGRATATIELGAAKAS